MAFAFWECLNSWAHVSTHKAQSSYYYGPMYNKAQEKEGFSI
jgi:hypothetical protein